MRNLVAAVILLGAGLVVPGTASAADPIYKDPTQPIPARVADLLGRMTLDEKVGQMTQAERNAVSDGRHHQLPDRLAAVRRRLRALAQQRHVVGGHVRQLPARGDRHAAGHPDDLRRRRGARPQQRRRRDDLPAQHRPRRDPRPGAGAADRPGHRRGGRRAPASTGTSRRACASPATTAGAAPTSRSARSRRSPSSMTTMITGLQGAQLSDSGSVLATAKHYIGDGGTTGGDDQGNTQVSEAELRAIHLPPFREAIAARRRLGDDLLQQLERHEAARPQVPDHRRAQERARLQRASWSRTGTASTRSTASRASPRPRCATSINAGIDMVMVPTEWRSVHHAAQGRGAGRPGADVAHRRRQPAHPDQEVRAGPVREAVDRPPLHARPSAARRTARWPARPCASRRCC